MRLLRGRLDYKGSVRKERGHVRAQDQAICASPQEPERRFVVKHVPHDSRVLLDLEEVIVIEATENSADLRIPEMPGPVERGDSRRELLPEAEVRCLPGYLLAKVDQPRRNPCNSSFIRTDGGLDMQVDVPRQIEAQLDWSIYPGGDLNYGYRRDIKRSDRPRPSGLRNSASKR